MQKLRFNKIDQFVFSFILCILFILPSGQVEAQNSVQQNQLKFGRLLRLVDGYYVDSTNVDALTEKAIVNLLTELDPHSIYISKEEVDKMNEPLEGNFEGVGISFRIHKDTLLVLSTISGGPSEKVGLRAGDRIVEVDDKNIAGIKLKNSDVLGLLKGKKGTVVNIKVLRRQMDELLNFSIIRDKIPMFSLDASYMLDESTGYIKLARFARTSTKEVLTALTNLKKQNLKNLIFDLRGNTGGYLDVSIEIADQFLKDRNLVVYTEGRKNYRKDYKATSKGTFKNGNLIILIDEGSASASEIVSGAVQDWDRGIIIGRRSYGKGLVQSQHFLTDGSLVRLTVAHYYTPSGRCIQKPYEEGVKEYHKDYVNRMNSGEMFSADSIEFDQSLKYKTLLNGRDVFGGGGVMPDIFIPMDTSIHYRYVNRLRRNNIINNYVLDYVDSNRDNLKNTYPDFKKFDKEFEVTDKMIEEIVAKGEEEKIEKNEESLEFAMENLKKEVKAFVARDIFSRNDLFKIFNKDDETILKALEIIENQKQYNNLLISTE